MLFSISSNSRSLQSSTVVKQIAALLGTTVAYLADGEKTEIGEDVMHVALLLQGMQNEELRKVAMEQVKLLAGVK